VETIRTILSALLGSTATVMAISVGVVSIIPTLLELVRSQSPEYFAGEELRARAQKNLRFIAHTIWLFGIVQLICVAGLIWPCPSLLIAACVSWCVTILLLLGFGFRLAILVIDSFRPVDS